MILPQQSKPLRVGLIGAGWYGKSDLLRLIQVAPVEVVALCDVDKNMLKEAAAIVSERLKTRKKPRLYSDYRKMLDENKFDIVLIGSPDHWHALHTIAAMEAGARRLCARSRSAWTSAKARRWSPRPGSYNRVVQVGHAAQEHAAPDRREEERSSTPGCWGRSAHVEMCCYFHMRANGNPPVEPVPDFLDYEMWTGPAPLRPYDGLPHRRWWRTFMEYGNGIVGDMCVHMLDTARWMLDLGWPKRISSTGGIYVQKDGKSNISDTQTAVFEYMEFNVRLAAPHLGHAARPGLPVGPVHLRRQGHPQGQHDAV